MEAGEECAVTTEKLEETASRVVELEEKLQEEESRLLEELLMAQVGHIANPDADHSHDHIHDPDPLVDRI